jgi:hypothetical protein
MINDPIVVSEVEAAFRKYELALNSNDIETLNAFFWNSGLSLRYGVGECLYGYDAIRSFRQARAGGSPSRSLGRTIITTFGDSAATVNTEFHRAGEQRLGRQSQVWIRMQEGWRIVAAHVSLQAERS